MNNESGVHRYQRVSPTEKRGRVHTSTITVACLPVTTNSTTSFNEKDLEWTFCRGSGAGGQHRNKTDSAVQLKHKPTGLIVRVETERSQNQNKEIALTVLKSRLAESERIEATNKKNNTRQNQIGGGERGEKRRTIALQRNQVTDHVTNRKVPADIYMNGNIEKCWN